MRKVVHKFFFVWDYDKEEKWLNEMAAKGLSLVSVKLLAYEFETTLPGEYHVCMQMLEHSQNHPETENYIHFLEDTGVEHVGNFQRTAYFRKRTSEGDFTLFSDTASRIRQLQYLITTLVVLLPINLCNGFNTLLMYIRWRQPSSLFASLFVFFIVGFLIRGIVRLRNRQNRLKKDQQLFE